MYSSKLLQSLGYFRSGFLIWTIIIVTSHQSKEILDKWETLVFHWKSKFSLVASHRIFMKWALRLSLNALFICKTVCLHYSNSQGYAILENFPLLLYSSKTLHLNVDDHTIKLPILDLCCSLQESWLFCSCVQIISLSFMNLFWDSIVFLIDFFHYPASFAKWVN